MTKMNSKKLGKNIKNHCHKCSILVGGTARILFHSLQIHVTIPQIKTILLILVHVNILFIDLRKFLYHRMMIHKHTWVDRVWRGAMLLVVFICPEGVTFHSTTMLD